MDYCKSDANTSADKPAQLEFLKAHPVLPLELEPDDVVLDHSVEYMDGEESRWVWVRYFAGPERRYSNIQSSDSPVACVFSLVTATNRTEDKAAMVRYTTSEGAPLELPEGQHCIGSAPPKIEEHEDGPTTVTLRCVTKSGYQEPLFHRKHTGLNHVAFKVESAQAVDAFVAKFLEPHKILTLYGGAKAYPQYTPNYYAVYFEDPDRIKIEVVYEGEQITA